MYLWNKKDSEKLDGDVSKINSLSADGKTIYYIKDDALYVKAEKKDRQKIASDVRTVYRIYDSGEIYYAKHDGRYDALWFFDGKEAERITDKLVGFEACAVEAPLFVYLEANSDETGKTFSRIAVRKNIIPVDQDDACYFNVDKEGKYLYYLADMSNDSRKGDLFLMTISGGKTGKTQRYDSEVANQTLRLTDSGSILYFKDYSNQKGDLYSNGKKVDSDVKADWVYFCEKTKQIIYLADYNNAKEQGRLMTASNASNRKKISDDVSHYAVAPNGYLLYLYDYSLKNYMGELYLYKGGKSIRLDEDVTAIIRFE